MKQYDYLIVGAGLYGAVFAHEAKKVGKRCLVIDKRGHIAGNIYTEPVEGINVHRYGAHIFHTNNKAVWQYVNQFAEFNRYTNSPVANYHGEIYNMPFNMNTFNKMWGVVTPAEARAKIEQQKAEARRSQILYKPSSEEVFSAIIPEYVAGIVYGAVCESVASELAARRTAMDAATKNAGEMIDHLNLYYNRARQAAIAQEITEIVAGAEI